MNLYSSIFTSGSLRKDVFIWIDCENNNHQYGFSIFSLLILCSSFPSLSSHLHEPDDAECGYCWGVIASLSYWSGSFKGKIKEVFVICLHRPDMKFSEAFRINTTLCVFVCFFFSLSYTSIVVFVFGSKFLVSDLLVSLAKRQLFLKRRVQIRRCWQGLTARLLESVAFFSVDSSFQGTWCRPPTGHVSQDEVKTSCVSRRAQSAAPSSEGWGCSPFGLGF